MKKLKELMKKIMPDELSAFIILGVYAVTLFTVIGLHALKEYNTIIATNAKVNMKEQVNENDMANIQNFTSVENVNSIEELQKINAEEMAKEKEKNKDKDEDKEKEKEKEEESTPPYYIKVNYGAQVVTVYGKDSKGNYTVPVRAMLCSTGTYTPTGGVYQIPAKYRWLDMIGDVYTQYCSQIVGDILFHSVPYLTKWDNSSLEWWAYDDLGSRVSLGCVRLTCEDAKWIYDNCRIGTKVEFYSSSDPGPLGRPSTMKISDAPDNIKGWDPTDPAEGNPWKKYLADLDKKKQEEENKKKEEEKKKQEEEKKKQEEANKVKVPDVTGLTEAKAKNKLAGLNVLCVYTNDKNRADGIVLKQSIKAGTSVKKGETITLTINKKVEEKPPVVDPKPTEPEPEKPDINSNVVDPNSTEPPQTGEIVDSNSTGDSEIKP